MNALVALLLAALAPAVPTGPPPEVPYAFASEPTFGGGNWELVRPDHTRSDFTETLGGFAAWDDVVVTGYATEGGFEVRLYDGEPALQHEFTGLCHYALVTTPARDLAAWLEDDGTLVRQHDSGSVDTGPVQLSCGGAAPVALRGPTLFVDGPRTTPVALRGAKAPRRITGLRTLADVAGRGHLVGRLPGAGHCWGLLRRGRDLAWQTCTDRLDSFAPGGRRVLGTTGRRLVVHDTRTGAVLTEWTRRERQRVDQVGWEDAEHLLVVARHPSVGWSVLRLGVDGSVEYAVPPVRTGAEFAPFRLPLS